MVLANIQERVTSITFGGLWRDFSALIHFNFRVSVATIRDINGPALQSSSANQFVIVLAAIQFQQIFQVSS